MNNRVLTLKPPRIAMAILILAALLHWLTPLGEANLLARRFLAPPTGLAGFLLMIRAWWQFKQQQVAICPTEETAFLITDGVYRFTRNPMYLGMIMMLVAVAFWFGTVPYFAAATAFFLIIRLVFCPYEERKLAASFGDEYRDYATQVRRWL